MAEAQFIPGGNPTDISGAFNSGLGTAQSMMERVQSMRVRDQQAQIAQQEEARRQAEFAILKPAMAAKATADMAEAKAHVTGLEQTEAARAAASEIIPRARAEFDALMQLEDPNMREAAGLQWIASFGHLENVGAYNKEVAAKKEIVAKMHMEASALRKLQLDINGQKEVAQIRGQTALAVADTRATAGDKIGRLRASLEEARSAGDQEGVTLYTNLLQKAQASPINTAYGSAQMHTKLEEARAAGDPEEIQFWEKRINALTERGVRKPIGLDDPRAKAFLGEAPVPNATTPQAKAPQRVRVKLEDLK